MPCPATPEESFGFACPAEPPVEPLDPLDPLEPLWPAELPCPDALPPYWAWATPAILKIITLEAAKTAACNRGIDVGDFMMSFPLSGFYGVKANCLMKR